VLIEFEVTEHKRVVTKCRRTEQERGEARALPEEILDSIADAFFTVDRQWRYTYLNQRAVVHARLALGREVTAKQLLGNSCWATFPEWVGTPVFAAYAQAMDEGVSLQLDGYVPRSDSWFDIRLYPSPSGVSTYLCDITDRKRATEQLGYHASLIANMEDAVVATDAQGVVTAWNKGAERIFGWSEPEALGRQSREVASSPLSEAEGDDAMRELAAIGRRRTEEARHRRDGTTILTDTLAVALRDEQGELAGFLGLARDISDRRRSERELERGISQQAAVAALGLRALRHGSVLPLMNEAASQVCRTLGVEYAEIDELIRSRRELVAVAGVGFTREAVILPMPMGRRSLSGFALLTGEPVLVEDLSAETRFSVPEPLRARGVLSAIVVLIGPGGTPFGTLTALSGRRRMFSPRDVSFLQSVANVLAAAIEQAEAAEKLEAARDAERGRVARDLHDEALRELTDAVALAAMARPARVAPDHAQRWDALTAALQRSGRQLRAAIYDLRRSSAEARPIRDLLAEMVATQTEMALGRRVELRGLVALPELSLGDTATELLRIVREAITNARLHSGATAIRVDAGDSNSEFICLDVNDDGDWPDRELAVRSRRGTGIAAMFERANRVGAELRIEVGPSGGTRVSVRLPFDGGAGEQTGRG
jgi:PAS domain S-box-containing protein